MFNGPLYSAVRGKPSICNLPVIPFLVSNNESKIQTFYWIGNFWGSFRLQKSMPKSVLVGNNVGKERVSTWANGV